MIIGKEKILFEVDIRTGQASAKKVKFSRFYCVIFLYASYLAFLLTNLYFPNPCLCPFRYWPWYSSPFGSRAFPSPWRSSFSFLSPEYFPRYILISSAPSLPKLWNDIFLPFWRNPRFSCRLDFKAICFPVVLFAVSASPESNHGGYVTKLLAFHLLSARAHLGMYCVMPTVTQST